MHESVSKVDYNVQLLINLEDRLMGGTLLVDTYTFDPKLAKGDTVRVEDWKVGSIEDGGEENKVFSFNATVIEIRKTIIRHQTFVVDFILESPDREIISNLRDALKRRN